MPSSTRRDFLGTTTLAGAGYFVAAGTRTAWSKSADEQLNVACIGVGGKGGSDSDNAALFGDVIAICDVDRKTLESKGESEKFKAAERFTDYREMLAKHGKNIDIVHGQHARPHARPGHARRDAAGHQLLHAKAAHAHDLRGPSAREGRRRWPTRASARRWATRARPSTRRGRRSPRSSPACSARSRRSTPGRTVRSGPRARAGA